MGLVLNDTIREVVTRHDTRETCRELVRLANEAGGPDNITVLVVQMPD